MRKPPVFECLETNFPNENRWKEPAGALLVFEELKTRKIEES
jgi:hypothetical protein